MTIWDRIQRVVASGLVRSERDWCEKAGLSTGYFSSMRQGLKEGRDVELGTRVVRQLAKAAGVRFEWLIGGAGPMREGDAPTESPITAAMFMPAIADVPNPKLRKALAIFVMEAKTEWDRHSLSHHLSLKASDGAKLTEEEWLHEIRNYSMRLRKGFGSFGSGIKQVEDD